MKTKENFAWLDSGVKVGGKKTSPIVIFFTQTLIFTCEKISNIRHLKLRNISEYSFSGFRSLQVRTKYFQLFEKKFSIPPPTSHPEADRTHSFFDLSNSQNIAKFLHPPNFRLHEKSLVPLLFSAIPKQTELILFLTEVKKHFFFFNESSHILTLMKIPNMQQILHIRKNVKRWNCKTWYFETFTLRWFFFSKIELFWYTPHNFIRQWFDPKVSSYKQINLHFNKVNDLFGVWYISFYLAIIFKLFAFYE